MSNRKATATIDHIITGTLLFLIFLFLNLSVSNSTVSTDFSGSGFYTLQKPTIKMMKELNSPLKITFYHMPQLTPRTPKYANMKQRVTSLLRLYKQYGGEHVQFEVKNPADQQGKNQITREVESRLMRDRVAPVVETVRRQGQEQKYKFYSSFAISYRANERVLNKVTEIDNLEYLLSQEIKYAMNPEVVKIGMYVPPRMTRSRRRGPRGGGGGGMQRQEDSNSFSTLETRLQEIGVVERIYLEEGERFPDPKEDGSIDVLLVLANRRIPESDLYALDQYIMKGGKAVIAADPIGLKPGGRMAMMRGGGGEQRGFLFSGSQSGKTLLDVLKTYGVKGSAGVTIDRTEVEIDRNKRRVRQARTLGGESRRRMYIETVTETVPFLFKASPSFRPGVPAFVSRAGEPLVMYPMSLKPSGNISKDNYSSWLTTSEDSVEIEPPSGGGRMGMRSSPMRTFHNQAFGYNFDNVSSKSKAKRDLVVSIRSQFPSAFPKEDVPAAMKPNEEGEKNEGTNKDGQKSKSSSDGNKKSENPEKNQQEDEGSEASKESKHLQKSEKTSLVVAGDTDLFKVNRMQRIRKMLLREVSMESPNQVFANETINHLHRGEEQQLDLKREKIRTPRLVQVGEKKRKYIYEPLIIGLAPLLVILFGLFRWGLIASGRKQIEL